MTKKWLTFISKWNKEHFNRISIFRCKKFASFFQGKRIKGKRREKRFQLFFYSQKKERKPISSADNRPRWNGTGEKWQIA